jgi:glucan 1,3-beta-glucosidase
MSPLSRVFLAFVACLAIVPAIVALEYGFPYGKEKIRGVNLGGWLVIEVCLTLYESSVDL